MSSHLMNCSHEFYKFSINLKRLYFFGNRLQCSKHSCPSLRKGPQERQAAPGTRATSSVISQASLWLHRAFKNAIYPREWLRPQSTSVAPVPEAINCWIYESNCTLGEKPCDPAFHKRPKTTYIKYMSAR